MATAPLSLVERQQAYQLLGVQEQELADIERAPYLEGETRLKRLKARVRKTFKHLARVYHPDHNPGDENKAAIFMLLIRACKELYARQAKRELTGVETTPRWRVSAVAVPSGGVSKPFMQVNVRRPQHGTRPDPREQAVRLGKMRP
jgi:hypothetical protein